ncbi:hypothetical protein EJ08DRAFT_733054 [Tothia fuscella]|uniref:Uncharacterized protein n=1 Tax=Tothia fuscella TaxID=1048955 RepID=A0A9P4TZH5_9PEZI|nr:hypothetical protein EJ08DRAFT_733054 [Tothia fuscella]
MGIPYSRQINTAFDQVTPLVAEGFQVLETTKNIAILLAWVQVLTVVLLALILFALVALLVTMNPDLSNERKALVTPIMRVLLHQGAVLLGAATCAVLLSAMVGGLWVAIHGKKVDDDVVDDDSKETPEKADPPKDSDKT